MALTDILIPEADPQQGIMELAAGSLNSPVDMLDSQGIEELVMAPAAGGNTYSRSRLVNV